MKASRIAALVFLVGCGYYPEEDLDFKVLEDGTEARGIYQGPNPPRGTVYDCCNLDLSEGTWKTRPAIVEMSATATLWSAGGAYHANGLGEFVPDPRVPNSSYYHALVFFGANASANVATEWQNAETDAVLTIPSGVDLLPQTERYSSVQHLWKRTTANGTEYGPALIFSSGINAPMVYHQFDGAGALTLLDAIDGGLTDMTYLRQPPHGRYLSVYRDRLFMANCADAANRIWFTSPDSGGAFVCNVWPSNYNLDVGHEPITGIIPYKEFLLVFNSHEIYALSGDGVGGQWSVSLVDGNHGAISGSTIVDGGDAIYFVSADGIYRFSGGEAKNISHPALQETWKVIHWNPASHFIPYSVFDPERENVMFFCNMIGPSTDEILVYNKTHGSWSRWGVWRADRVDDSPIEIYHRTFGLSVYSREIGGVVGYMGGSTGGDPRVGRLVLSARDAYSTGTYLPIHWFIRTQRYPISEIANLRRVGVDADMTGDWQMSVLALVDDESDAEALRRTSLDSAGDIDYNMLVDSTSATTHDVTGSRKFASGNIVEVTYLPMNTRIYSALTLAGQGTDITKIVFPSAVDSSNRNGELMVTYSGTSTMRFLTMYESTDTLPGTATNATIELRSEKSKEQFVGINATGRKFQLWLSNVGSYVTANKGGDYIWAKEIASEIYGWKLVYRPLRTLRP